MKKFIDSVKALGEKMTGKEIKGKNLIDVIDETAENYQGGAGSGSEIVDALPAQGLEGSTYLLRKDESKNFKAQAYAPLYDKNQEVMSAKLTMIDPDVEFLLSVISERLNPNLSDGLVDFSVLAASLFSGVKSSEEWNTLITSNKVAIVKTEEDVLNITEDVDYIFQDLGVIGIEDLNIIEIKQSDGRSLAFLASISNNLCFNYVVQNDKVSARERTIVPASKSGTGKNYRFEDKPIGSEPAPFAGTLTDTYVYDQETLMSLEEGTNYFINLTPMTPEYSYTQYVFDQGVYSPIGEGTSSAGGQGDQYLVNALWVCTILQNSVKPKNYGFNLRQFILDYITEDINNPFCLISAQDLPNHNGESYSMSYGIYVGLGTYNGENYIFVFQSQSFSNAENFLSNITTLDDAIAYYRVVTQKDNFYDTLLANVTDEPITGMYEGLADQISSTAGTGHCVAKNIKFESAAASSDYSYSFFKSWSLNDVLSYFLQLPRVK